MTQTKKSDGSVVKGMLVGTAVLAGVAAAIAMRDEKTRKKVEKSLSDMRAKSMELKTKATEWMKDHPIQDNADNNFMRKNPIKEAARAIASA